ncbi:MAG: hypothetical protein A2428_18020 [Bdellovibrionales bacterium RIFOXYC1_FULL_54_43]|nr:MAG: hypothetical protein A2428_18020 [Bdellovibrionales bacterium RIFOXYC1_FULL_54_43]
MQLTTDALDEHGFFDPRYTCEFDNSSPELRWENPPEGTSLFAMLAEDLDSVKNDKPFSHWVIFDIPGHIRHLPAGIPPQDALPNGIRQGVNSLGKLGYTGPCPPLQDRPHRYVFRLFALRAGIATIPNRATADQLLEAIQPFTIETAEVRGSYERAVRKVG